MHSKIGKFDLRQNHFHNEIFSVRAERGGRLDNQLPFRVQPIIEVVAFKAARST